MQSRAVIVIVPSLIFAASFAACGSFGDGDPMSAPPNADGGGDATPPEPDAAEAGKVDGGPIAHYGAAILADNPFAYWRFMEGVTANTLKSEVGSYLLVPANPPPTFGTTGVFGAGSGSIAFAGTIGERVGSSTVPALEAPFAFEAWLSLSTVADPTIRTIATLSKNEELFELTLSDAGLMLKVRTGGTDYLAAGQALQETRWNHVVAQSSAPGAIELHVNTFKFADVTQSNEGSPEAFDFSLGAADAFGTAIGPGTRLAEVALYDHVLAPERIAAHYTIVFP